MFKYAADESLPALFYFTAAWCGPCKIYVLEIVDICSTLALNALFSFAALIFISHFHSSLICNLLSPLSCTGKFISPVIGQLSEKYPHVTTYKIDIDKVIKTTWQKIFF